MPITDTYERTWGITEAVAVTPSNDTTAAPVLANARGLYVGVSGDVAVILAESGATVTMVGLAAGVWHPIAVRYVLSTGTTATNILLGR